MRAPGEAPATPEAIEARSFAIIDAELRERGFGFSDAAAPVVKRVIHATADFEYAESLFFSDGAITEGRRALECGCPVVTDTRMAFSGINKKALGALGGAAHCLIGDGDVADRARREGCTRSRVAVDKASERWPEGIYVVGNAPTALIRICELIREGRLRPRLVIGAPVGFVNVVESKEMLMECAVPRIVARGRKGGSNVAAAICNALLYGLKSDVS